MGRWLVPTVAGSRRTLSQRGIFGRGRAASTTMRARHAGPPHGERSGVGAGWARLLLRRLVELDQEDRLPRNAVFVVIRRDDDPTACHRLQLAAYRDFGPIRGTGSRRDGRAATCAQPIPAAEL